MRLLFLIVFTIDIRCVINLAFALSGISGLVSQLSQAVISLRRWVFRSRVLVDFVGVAERSVITPQFTAKSHWPWQTVPSHAEYVTFRFMAVRQAS